MISTRRGTGLLAAALFLAPGFAPADAAAPLQDAVAWLESQQRSSGAFGADNAPADQVAEGLAALAVGGGNDDSRDRALDYVRVHGPARAREQAAYAARIVIGLVAAGKDPTSFEGTDYVAIIRDRYNPILATHGGNLYSDAIAGLGRLVGGDRPPQAYLDRLAAARCPNGGWSWQDRCGSQPDADTTSVVISTLAMSGDGKDSPAIAEGLAWLRSLQADNGAFPTIPGTSPNANTTGLVVTAVATVGLEPRSFGRADPVLALESFATEEGALAYTAGGRPNLYATIQGVPGLAAAGHPFGPPPTPKPSPSASGGPAVPALPSPVPSVLPTRLPVPAAKVSAASTSLPSAGDEREAAVVAARSTPERESNRPLAAVAAIAVLAAGVTFGAVRIRLRGMP